MKSNLSYPRNLTNSQYFKKKVIIDFCDLGETLVDFSRVIVRGNTKIHQGEVNRGISIIQCFHRRELSYVIYIEEVENSSFFQ